jgi:hypothetical protein
VLLLTGKGVLGKERERAHLEHPLSICARWCHSFSGSASPILHRWRAIAPVCRALPPMRRPEQAKALQNEANCDTQTTPQKQQKNRTKTLAAQCPYLAHRHRTLAHKHHKSTGSSRHLHRNASQHGTKHRCDRNHARKARKRRRAAPALKKVACPPFQTRGRPP